MAGRNKKNLGSLIVLGVLLLLYLLFFKKPADETTPKRNKSDKQEIDFRHQRIYYTKHAKCRMECRNIDESEVKEILQNGEINFSKSDLKDQPCPKYAVEGKTHDGQEVRIIVGNCKTQASIVTVIDLKNDFECDCE